MVLPLLSVVVWATTTGTTGVAPAALPTMVERHWVRVLSRAANCELYSLGMAEANQSGRLVARRAE